MSLRCYTCGHPVVQNMNASEWDWPYACTYCDADKLPEYLRQPKLLPKLTRWQHFKKAIGL